MYLTYLLFVIFVHYGDTFLELDLRYSKHSSKYILSFSSVNLSCRAYGR